MNYLLDWKDPVTNEFHSEALEGVKRVVELPKRGRTKFVTEAVSVIIPTDWILGYGPVEDDPQPEDRNEALLRAFGIFCQTLIAEVEGGEVIEDHTSNDPGNRGNVVGINRFA